MPNTMIWLLGGYVWLFIHRPFEIWHWHGDFPIERAYMIVTTLYWLLVADKQWVSNRLNAALASFWCVVLVSCLLSPYGSNIEGYAKVSYLYLMLIT
ncbi:MAG: hypothetical protein ABFC96_09900, partial [Thermoguttaceae bacterium]